MYFYNSYLRQIIILVTTTDRRCNFMTSRAHMCKTQLILCKHESNIIVRQQFSNHLNNFFRAPYFLRDKKNQYF